MSNHVPLRRLLLAAADDTRAELQELFEAEPLRNWQVIEANSLQRARFILQLDSCDVLLLDGELIRRDGGGVWTTLAGPWRVPVLILTDGEAETVAAAVHHGAHYWLPREAATRYAPVLAAMLEQAAEFGDAQRRGQQACSALEDCRRQVSRLVNLLWEAAPGEAGARWLTQRHMLERCEEEVTRAQRYGGALAVILGEVENALPSGPTVDEMRQTMTRTVERISRIKRRSDVAGQYGLQGFMMLLPQTVYAGAVGCCRRLQTILEQPAPSFGPLRIRFGIACYCDDAASVKSLLSRAEERLEHAKQPLERSARAHSHSESG